MLGVALIEGVLLAVLITVAVRFMTESANEALIKRASTTSRLFATTTKDAVLSFDLASLDMFTVDLLQNPDIKYVKVLSSNGELLSSAGDDKLIKKPFSLDSSVESVKDDIFDVQALISEGSTVYGSVQIGIVINSITQSMNRVRKWTVSIALIEMLLVAIFSYFLGVYLTKNLYRLRKDTHNIAKNVKIGKYNHEVTVIKSGDELEDLSTAFSELSHTLKEEYFKRSKYEIELIELNASLEERVARRTAQLSKQKDELEKAYQELSLAQKKLIHSEKMASVGQLAAGVAHEINNPLGYVSSNLKVLQEYMEHYYTITQILLLFNHAEGDGKLQDITQQAVEFLRQEDFSFLNEDSQDLLDASLKGLERIRSIVLNLKQFSRENGEGMEPCNLNDCINIALNMVHNELKYHCQVTTDLKNLPNASINEGKIIQVLTNLLINASQAVEKEGLIHVTSSHEGDYVFIRIRDNGSGIAPDILNRIFDPFFTTKPVGIGTGLGLSICYDIMVEHQGNIEVESKLSKGTTFTLTFPVCQEMPFYPEQVSHL
ncbi:histidine kinase [Paraneptunicella aestuarii]|nr:histidine kinase [Paraneptunicella aestuarii]